MNKKNVLLSSVFLLGVGACSTSPQPLDSGVVSSAPDTRDSYISYVDKKLTQFQNESGRLKDPTRLRSSIQDARIELAELKNSTNPNWHSYRSRLDGAMVKIERTYSEAAK